MTAREISRVEGPVGTNASDAEVEAAAEAAHNTYETLAPAYVYATREESRVPWDDLPENHKALMRDSIRAALDAAASVAVPGAREAEEVCEALERVIAYSSQDNVSALEMSLRLMLGDESPAAKLEAWRRAQPIEGKP